MPADSHVNLCLKQEGVIAALSCFSSVKRRGSEQSIDLILSKGHDVRLGRARQREQADLVSCPIG